MLNAYMNYSLFAVLTQRFKHSQLERIVVVDRFIHGGPEKVVHISTRHIFGTVRDKMKRISPKCFQSF